MDTDQPDSENRENLEASEPAPSEVVQSVEHHRRRSIGGASPTPPMRPIGFQFTGETGEYFKIWIVNLLLSVVTLGFYWP